MTSRKDPTPDSAPPAAAPTLICPGCHGAMRIRPEWSGREVRCPHCDRPLVVPSTPASRDIAVAHLAGRRHRLRFNFPCPACAALLESHTGLTGQPASCPSCGTRLTVPDVDTRTGQPGRAHAAPPDDTTPVPTHAYAADGLGAPRIFRHPDGEMSIECPRCGEPAPIDSEACPVCGTPFTAEAVVVVRTDYAGGLAAAACIVMLLTPIACLAFGWMLPALIGASAAVGFALTSWLADWTLYPRRSAIAAVIGSLVWIGVAIANQ